MSDIILTEEQKAELDKALAELEVIAQKAREATQHG